MIQLFSDSQTLRQRLGKLDLMFADINHIDNLFNDEIVITDPQAARTLCGHRKDLMILVLSDLPNYLEGSELLALGIRGYGNSYMFRLHFEQAIAMLEGGNIWLYPGFMQEMIGKMQSNSNNQEAVLSKLTDREQEIALHVSEGCTNKEIATQLNITERTVKQHLSHIFEKLDVTDRLSLALLLK